MLKTGDEAGAGQKIGSIQIALIGRRREGSPTLLPALEQSRKAAARINVPLRNGTTDQTRKERADGRDPLGENGQVAQNLTGTNGQPSPHPKMLHREKRTAPLIDELLSAQRGNAVLPLDTEMHAIPQLVPQTGHQNRATLHPEQGLHPGDPAAAHQTLGGGMLTDRTHQ